jgi:hypothetical protein
VTVADLFFAIGFFPALSKVAPVYNNFQLGVKALRFLMDLNFFAAAIRLLKSQPEPGSEKSFYHHALSSTAMEKPV